MSTPRPEKRTNGRLIMLRAGVRALAALAPPLADRVAMDLFYRPLRRHDEPEVPALACHRWRVRTRAGWLTAWDYGAGPTVLMIHGWSGVAGQWGRFIGPLVQAGYNAVAIDLPAHGSSEGTRTNLEEYVQAVLDTADRIKPIHGRAKPNLFQCLGPGLVRAIPTGRGGPVLCSGVCGSKTSA